jgi:predicted Zn-dependent peptidase
VVRHIAGHGQETPAEAGAAVRTDGDSVVGDSVVGAAARQREASTASAAVFTPGVHLRGRSTEQQGIILGTRGLPEGHADRFTHLVMSNLLGGGMASRLFQRVREERGLAYTVQTVLSQYSDTGLFGIYAGSAPESAGTVLDLVGEELARLARELPSAQEVDDVVSQLAGGTVLGLESTAVRMNRIARHELTGLPLLSPEAIIEAVRAVTPDHIRTHAAALLGQEWALAGVGPREDLVLPALG